MSHYLNIGQWSENEKWMAINRVTQRNFNLLNLDNCLSGLKYSNKYQKIQGKIIFAETILKTNFCVCVCNKKLPFSTKVIQYHI